MEERTYDESMVDAFSAIIDSLGTKQFYAQLTATLIDISHYESMVMIAYPKGQKPFLVFENLADEHKQATLDVYFNGGYFLDPFYEAANNDEKDGIYRLIDVAPDEFYNTQYYQEYYKGTKLKDEIGIMVTYEENIKVILSLGLRAGSSADADEEREMLSEGFPIFNSLCQKHWQKVGLQASPDNAIVETELGQQLNKAFKNFATDFLSDRECEIVRLILKGYSSKSIAELLEISIDTVKVHRKRIHQKLDVSSHSEFFSLFLTSLSLVEVGSDVDPLTLYYS